MEARDAAEHPHPLPSRCTGERPPQTGTTHSEEPASVCPPVREEGGGKGARTARVKADETVDALCILPSPPLLQYFFWWGGGHWWELTARAARVLVWVSPRRPPGNPIARGLAWTLLSGRGNGRSEPPGRSRRAPARGRGGLSQPTLESLVASPRDSVWRSIRKRRDTVQVCLRFSTCSPSHRLAAETQTSQQTHSMCLTLAGQERL